MRTPLENVTVYPPIERDTLTHLGRRRRQPRVGCARCPVRAAIDLAIIGGSPGRFKPFADLYREALEKLGRPALPIAVHSPGHVAATDEQARNELWPHYETMINRIGGERGWPPATRAQFDREAGPDGALCVGSPETVAAKIIRTARALGLSRFDMKYSAGDAAARHADEEHRADWQQGGTAGPRRDERVAITPARPIFIRAWQNGPPGAPYCLLFDAPPPPDRDPGIADGSTAGTICGVCGTGIGPDRSPSAVGQACATAWVRWGEDSRVLPNSPGGTPPASRHSKVSCPRWCTACSSSLRHSRSRIVQDCPSA